MKFHFRHGILPVPASIAGSELEPERGRWRLMLGSARLGLHQRQTARSPPPRSRALGAGICLDAMVLVLPEPPRQGYASRLLRSRLPKWKTEARFAARRNLRPARVYVQKGSGFLGLQALFHCKAFGVRRSEPLDGSHWAPYTCAGRRRVRRRRSRCCAISPRASRRRHWFAIRNARSPDSCWREG